MRRDRHDRHDGRFGRSVVQKLWVGASQMRAARDRYTAVLDAVPDRGPRLRIRAAWRRIVARATHMRYRCTTAAPVTVAARAHAAMARAISTPLTFP